MKYNDDDKYALINRSVGDLGNMRVSEYDSIEEIKEMKKYLKSVKKRMKKLEEYIDERQEKINRKKKKKIKEKIKKINHPNYVVK